MSVDDPDLNKGSAASIPIVRGSDFSQIYADAFLPLPLNNGIDIAVLAATPLINGQSFTVIRDDRGVERLSAADIEPASTFTEVSRIRLDADGFENLFTIVLGIATQGDLVDHSRLKSLFETAIAELKMSDTENG